MTFSVFPHLNAVDRGEARYSLTSNRTGLRLALYRRKEMLMSLCHDCTLCSL